MPPSRRQSGRVQTWSLACVRVPKDNRPGLVRKIPFKSLQGFQSLVQESGNGHGIATTKPPILVS